MEFETQHFSYRLTNRPSAASSIPLPNFISWGYKALHNVTNRTEIGEQTGVYFVDTVC